MATVKARPARARGSIDELPSGAMRVRVYAGKDPLTGRRHDLIEIVAPGPTAAKEAEKARTRMLSQIDEQRNPKTRATVNQLMDRYEPVLDVERTTKRAYLGYIKNHIRPLLGKLQAGKIDSEVLDSFYAELRRCRKHCDRGKPGVDHRTQVEHACDPRCGPHQCRPLAAATIRQIHWILSGAFDRTERWGWVSRSPMIQAQPPAAPTPRPQPPSVEDAGRLLTEASKDPDWGTLVWLTIITGARRGELCGLRWHHIDFDTCIISLEVSQAQDGSEVFEKDTKTTSSVVCSLIRKLPTS